MKKIFSACLSVSVLAAASLVACGGGGDASQKAPYLSGVAAYGAPMAGATVSLTDSNGSQKMARADSDGNYTLDVKGLTAPFLIKASGTSGDSVKEYTTLVASAPNAGETAIANVTPLTHALVSMMSSDGASPDEFADISKLRKVDHSKLNAALIKLQTALKNVLADANLPPTFNPITVSFKADRASAADILLETIKVSVSDQGVGLTNVRVAVDDTGQNTVAATLTIKGLDDSLPMTALPKSFVSASNLSGLDGFVKDANACLALPPANRASKDNSGNYTFQGACSTVNGFDVENYKANGYTLGQLWGRRLVEEIPPASRLLSPEFMLFLEGGEKALVRLTSTSPTGGKVYFETAAKGADGTWKIVGNQRKYNAGVSVRFYRQNDRSTNGWILPASFTAHADAGKNVGKFDAYSSRLLLSFDQMGPNGSNVYAVLVKGPGLPVNGVVLARSSACGTSSHLAFYSNDGTLPEATAVNPTTSASNSWILDVANFGDAYKGTDFYNQYRELSSASTSPRNNMAVKGSVNLKDIPEFALYTWEVFTTTSGKTPADSFKSRIVTRPLAATEGSKLPWATLNKDALEYLDPANPTKSTELTKANFSWTLPTPSTPAVTAAYVYGSNNTGRMSMAQNVTTPGVTNIQMDATELFDGNGAPCPNSKVPTFKSDLGYREVGTLQTMDRGLVLQQYSYHTGRAQSSASISQPR